MYVYETNIGTYNWIYFKNINVDNEYRDFY